MRKDIINNETMGKTTCMSFPLVGNLSERPSYWGLLKDSGQARMTVLNSSIWFYD